jgi:hypothetical protein
MTTKYVFSGHESFSCKSLWLKKGYDFVCNGNKFNEPDAVIDLGVGKNMVSSIRYWLRAFNITENDRPTAIGDYLLNTASGKDPYIEDLGTLWLLHFQLVYFGEATLYNWLFLRLQRERKNFDRTQVLNAVRRYMIEASKIKQFNQNTVKKDIGVLLQNYVQPTKAHSFEEYSALLLDLDLIKTDDGGKTYAFNIEGKRKVAPEIFLYAIIKSKGDDMTIPYEALQNLGLIFCMNDMETITMLQNIADNFHNSLDYSDIAGIRQLQFKKEIYPKEVLDKYYGK